MFPDKKQRNIFLLVLLATVLPIFFWIYIIFFGKESGAIDWAGIILSGFTIVVCSYALVKMVVDWKTWQQLPAIILGMIIALAFLGFFIGIISVCIYYNLILLGKLI